MDQEIEKVILGIIKRSGFGQGYQMHDTSGNLTEDLSVLNVYDYRFS